MGHPVHLNCKQHLLYISKICTSMYMKRDKRFFNGAVTVCQNIVITQSYYLLYYKEKRGLGKHTNHRQACCVLLGIESQITTATVSSM